MKKRWTRSVRLFLLITLTLVTIAQSEAQQLKPFIFLVASPVHITSLPVWVALASGYFAEQGLDVRIVSGTGGALGIPMLLSGEGQVGAFGDTAVRAAFQGAPVRVVATPVNGANFYLYSRTDIANVNDLKGKTIGVSTLNSTPQVLTMRILSEHYGWMDPAREVRWSRLGGQRLQALQSRTVEAVVVDAPDNVYADRLGFRKHFTTTDFIAIPSGGITVTAEYMRRNPSDLKKFLAGHLKGLRRALADSAYAVSLIEQRLKIDGNTAKAIYMSQLSTFTTSDMVPEAALKLSLGINKQQIQKVAYDLKPSDVFDFGVMVQVVQEADASGWKPKS
ncbi:MAG TPA: ABC transporter substrate-binding protein [Candidatus Binatia bacterium]|jgi:NitT/TauT family transport system substrate-binding protein